MLGIQILAIEKFPQNWSREAARNHPLRELVGEMNWSNLDIGVNLEWRSIQAPAMIDE